ncbi:MAG: oligosaccharide flippase family protein [Frankiaceae bacterium]|nr:oligosaccharide flippase family protein [Frankiaceae bacterium]
MSVLPAGFRRSALSNYLATASSLVLALVTVPLLTSGLGRTGYGVWVLVGSLIMYLEIFEFGFGTTTIRYVADASSREDEQGVRTAIATSFWLLVVPGIIALLVGLAVAWAFPALFSLHGDTASAARLLVVLLAVDLAISIPGDTFGGVLIAMQRFDLLNATLISVLLAQTAAIAVVLALGGGLVALGAATTVISLLGQLARYLFARRLVPGMSLRPSRARRELVRPYAVTSVWFSLNEVSVLVVQRLDAVVVGGVVGVAAAGVYAVGQKLAMLGDRLIDPVVGAFFPHAAAQAARGERAAVRASSLAAFRLATAVALPPTLLTALLAGPLLDLWVGPRFAEAEGVVVYLAGAVGISALRRPAQNVLNGVGKPRVVALISVAEAVTNLTLSIALGRAIGLTGVAVATLITTTSATVLLVLPYFCREVGIPARRIYGAVASAHLLPAAVVSALALGLRSAEPGGSLGVLLGGMGLGLLYFGLLTRTGLSGPERAALRAALGRRRLGQSS